jgi:hypothetical protein
MCATEQIALLRFFRLSGKAQSSYQSPFEVEDRL